MAVHSVIIHKRRATTAAVLIGALAVLHVIVQFANAMIVADDANDSDAGVSGSLISIIPAPRPYEPLVTLMRKRRAENSTAQVSCLNKYGPMCGDCNTLWSCVGEAEPALRQNCEETHPGRPLCERNACTAVVSNHSKCATHTQCTGQGYFPNPINCQQFYFCAGAGNQSLLYECPPGFAYNASSTRCHSRNSNDLWCVQLDCQTHANRYLEYPGDRQLYAFCLRQLGVLKPIMLRCSCENHFFNATVQRCEFECTAEGRFGDDTDPLAFYECLPAGTGSSDGWMVQRQHCLPGFVFAPLLQQCRWNATVDWHRQTFDERTSLAGPVVVTTTPSTNTTRNP